MPRAICRCGHALTVPTDPDERVVCAGCGARVRIRRKPVEIPPDGFLRFFCPCGRKLKVNAENPPATGMCPDCGRHVPVPTSFSSKKPPGHPEAETQELTAADRDAIDRWAAGHQGKAPRDDQATTAIQAPAPQRPIMATLPDAAASDRQEVGLRVCPKCGQPVHLGAEACRGCGTPVPRR